MTTEDPTNPPAGGSGKPASAPVIDWESDDNPYKKRFAGMQKSYSTLQTEVDTYKTKTFDLDAALKTALGEKDAFALRVTNLTEKHDVVSGELDVIKETLARQNVIIAEFPDLLDFEKQGLLPDGAGDELKTKLGAFKTALTARGAAAAQAQLKGATPPAPPPPAGTKGPEDIKAEAFKAMREGKVEDYNRLMDEYFKASAK